MLTKIYKIIDNCDDTPVYVGVTTRTVKQRFEEHVRSKNLDPNKYRCETIITVKHGLIVDIVDYVRERNKIKALEKYYIEFYSTKYRLLNISAGGEWGANILHRLLNNSKVTPENAKYFKEIYFKELIHSWISSRTRNSVERLFKHWIGHRSKNNVKALLCHWITHEVQLDIKCLLFNWINSRSRSITKDCLKNWISNSTRNPTKALLNYWICHNSDKNLTKYLLRRWITNKFRNPVKELLRTWIRFR